MSDDEVQFIEQVGQPVAGSSSSSASLFPPSHHLHHRTPTPSFDNERNMLRVKGSVEALKEKLKEMHMFLLATEDMLYYIEEYK